MRRVWKVFYEDGEGELWSCAPCDMPPHPRLIDVDDCPRLGYSPGRWTQALWGTPGIFCFGDAKAAQDFLNKNFFTPPVRESVWLCEATGVQLELYSSFGLFEFELKRKRRVAGIFLWDAHAAWEGSLTAWRLKPLEPAPEAE